MKRSLHVWAGDARVGRIDHEGREDRWDLHYDLRWVSDPQSFPLSPVLPFARPTVGYASPSVKRFIEHLLPEGRALDVAVDYNGLARTNTFGLIWALGAETAGALRFTADASAPHPSGDSTPREIPLEELDQRLREREHMPLTVWDGKVRMSVAGLQDKLLVYLDPPVLADGRLFLVEGQRLASTHILKPDSASLQTPHLAVNEHFCMSLARRMKLPVAEVGLLRTPQPVLMVRRFDREVVTVGEQRWVRRLHIVDAAQACDLPVAYKYERNFGSGDAVRHIRDGVSFERLFRCADSTANKAAARLAILRWALFQFLIGNSDAHGKNFSFFVRSGGLLEPAPWYDLVSVLQYDSFDTDLAMAYGDTFSHAEVSSFDLADFAKRCDIDRKLLRREGQRLARLAEEEAVLQAQTADYQGEAERIFVHRIASFVIENAKRLAQLVADAARWTDEYL